MQKCHIDLFMVVELEEEKEGKEESLEESLEDPGNKLFFIHSIMHKK